MADRFDKFTERERRVLTLAQEEALRFNHNYIGTEHLLLGLVREGEGVAAKVLANLGVELNKVRSAVEFIIGRGASATTTSARSTCFWVWCVRARGSPPACWRAWVSAWRSCARRSPASFRRACRRAPPRADARPPAHPPSTSWGST